MLWVIHSRIFLFKGQSANPCCHWNSIPIPTLADAVNTRSLQSSVTIHLYAVGA